MIGSTLARLAVDAGYEVVLSNSRGPETLAELAAELGPLVTAGTAGQAAEAARTWWITAGWAGLPSRGATEIATNSSPVRPAAQVATAVNSSR